MNRVVLGVDPGSQAMGFGVVAAGPRHLAHVAHGRISPRGPISLADRLCQLYDGLMALLSHHRPHSLALEEVFLAKNVKTAFILGQVQGVVLLAAAKARVPVHLYPALVVKKAVVGYGQASKAQVQLMVEQLLGLKVADQHAADALAVGVCHLFHLRAPQSYA